MNCLMIIIINLLSKYNSISYFPKSSVQYETENNIYFKFQCNSMCPILQHSMPSKYKYSKTNIQNIQPKSKHWIFKTAGLIQSIKLHKSTIISISTPTDYIYV